MTFRLPEELLEELKAEAENEQVSVNTLVNQVLNRHVGWERHSNKLGFLQFPRPFVREIFRDVDNKRIQQIACDYCKDDVKELILMKEGIFSLITFISMFNEWLRASSLVHRYKKIGESHHYVIYHKLNEKFSVYLASLLMSVLDDLQECTGEISMRKDSISATIIPLSQK